MCISLRPFCQFRVLNFYFYFYSIDLNLLRFICSWLQLGSQPKVEINMLLNDVESLLVTPERKAEDSQQNRATPAFGPNTAQLDLPTPVRTRRMC